MRSVPFVSVSSSLCCSFQTCRKKSEAGFLLARFVALLLMYFRSKAEVFFEGVQQLIKSKDLRLHARTKCSIMKISLIIQQE